MPLTKSSIYSEREILNQLFDEKTGKMAVSGGSTDDLLRNILNRYNANLWYRDDFSQGFQGWQYQFDSTGRTGITLTEEARVGNYALLIHTRRVASDQGWARKGMRFPSNAKKAIYGHYWSFHAANANNPKSIQFDLDIQTGAGTQRRYYSLRYFNHDGTSLQTKWQVNTGTPTAQAFTDVTGGTEDIPWNESAKPMQSFFAVVLDLQSQKYERLYSNGNEYDLTGLAGPTAGTSLSNFNMGMVHLLVCENRANTSEDCLLTIERPFLAFVF